MPLTDLADVCKVLEIYSQHSEDIFWQTDGAYAPVTFFGNCNDMFCWGTADCEEITKEDIPDIEQALMECLRVDKRTPDDTRKAVNWFTLLWIARKRGLRPQGAAYDNKSYIPEKIWRLFNACGPHRPASTGNPQPTPEL
jgi:hypothetical protein